MRKEPLVNNEYYHIYNRGVDKRNIFLDKYDFLRFLQGMKEFNSVDPIGSIYRNAFNRRNKKLSDPTTKLLKEDPLVEIVCYCLNPNHYHIILKQVSDNGISSFMKKLGGGYSRYFNEKHGRVGSLFQGRFKAVYINSNEYLLYLSSYVNLNNKVHSLDISRTFSSWNKYTADCVKYPSFCKKEIILSQFKTKKEYKNFARQSLKSILERRLGMVENVLLEKT
jgi:REP element-mobilizing transposase RayT